MCDVVWCAAWRACIMACRYYVLCSEKHNVAGQMYRVPSTASQLTPEPTSEHVSDLSVACGDDESGAVVVAQGLCPHA